MKTMIRNKGILFSALASMMMMTACDREEDMLSAESNEPTGRVLYATSISDDFSNPQSRMSYEDNLATNYMKLAWSESDAFSAFIQSQNAKYDFKIVAKEDGTSYTADETFKCESIPKWVKDGSIFDAIYPSVPEGTKPWQIELNLATQEQKGNGNTDHLKQYDYMVGHATYDATKPDSVNFSFKNNGDGISGRLASIYRIKMALPPTVTSVNKIEISCRDSSLIPSLVTTKSVKFSKGETLIIDGKKGTVTLKIADGKVNNGQFVAYVMLLPSDVKQRTITVTATDEKGEITFIDTKDYEKEEKYTCGKFKLINLDLKSVYEMDDYKEWNEVNCKGASSRENLIKYLNAGVYWDDGKAGKNQQTYVALNDKGSRITCHAGLWMKKLAEIGENAGKLTTVTVKDGTMNVGRPTEDEIDKYFFLPAAGFYSKTAGSSIEKISNAGILGWYWSSAPLFGEKACYLFFNKEKATLARQFPTYRYLFVKSE